MNKAHKNVWLLMIVILSGLVIGGFIGNFLGTIKYFEWINYGKTFGMTSPLVLNLDIISLQFAFNIRFTIAGIIGMILSVLIYKKF